MTSLKTGIKEMEVGLLIYVEFFGPDTVLSTSIAQLKTTVRYIYTK